jgi:selenocysteine lyase/cysteine desulfurase
VIEDVSHAHGGRYKGRLLGTIGDIGCFSFFANKVITTGEGGMVTTHSQTFADQARKLTNHGRSGPYHHDILGFNFRLTNIAAAIGLGVALDWMKTLDWDAVRNHEIRLTHRLIDGLTAIAGVRLLGPIDTRNRRGVISFVIEDLSPEEICRSLDARGVALRGGHHCAQPLLRAFGVAGAARASLAPYSMDADVDVLLEGVEDLIRSGRKKR